MSCLFHTWTVVNAGSQSVITLPPIHCQELIFQLAVSLSVYLLLLVWCNFIFSYFLQKIWSPVQRLPNPVLQDICSLQYVLACVPFISTFIWIWSTTTNVWSEEMHFLWLVFVLQEMKLSQLRPLRLQNLSQRGTWGGRKVTPYTLVASDTDASQTTKKLNKGQSFVLGCLNSFLLTAVGDTVSEDEVVCEIETDKVKQNKCDTNSLCLWLLAVVGLCLWKWTFQTVWHKVKERLGACFFPQNSIPLKSAYLLVLTGVSDKKKGKSLLKCVLFKHFSIMAYKTVTKTLKLWW